MKTPAAIEREYGVEKWGKLLERAREFPDGADLATVDGWVNEGAPSTLVAVGDELVEMTAREAHAAYRDFMEGVLAPYLPATSLTELGCGYGSVILAMARRSPFSGIPLFAGDYTATGPTLALLIATTEQIGITAGACDFTRSPVTSVDVPAGSLIYTSYAAQCVEPLTNAFVDRIAALKPAAVVHIEPVLEHCDPDTVLGLLRRRYIEANGYNRNLVTLLHEEAARGRIRLLEETRSAFGTNPLLAASVIAWAPVEDATRTASSSGGDGDSH